MDGLLVLAAGLAIGSVLFAVALMMRHCARVLQEGGESTQLARVFISAAGPLFATIGMAWLLIALSILGAFHEALALTPTFIPALVCVLAAACCVVASFVMQFTSGRRALALAAATTSDEFFHDPDTAPAPKWWTSPLGLTTLACVMLAVMGAAFLFVDLSVGANSNVPPPSGLMIGGALALILALTGMALLRCGQLLQPAMAPGFKTERDQLADMLRKLSILYFVLAVLFGLIAGLAVLIILGMLAIGALAASYRASRLGTMWTVATTLGSGRTLADELAAQSNATTGRARDLLQRASDSLNEGQPLSHMLYESGVVPRGCWLQAAGGLASGKLPEALRAAAARETTRFAQASGTDHTRYIAVYLGALCMVIMFIVGFVMYYIVPKFKKIFEDFNTELPNATQALISVSDSVVNYWYIMLPLPMFALALFAMLEFQSMLKGWSVVVEQYFGPYWVRLRAPDLLRGLRWAVEADRPLDQVLMQMANVPLPMAYRARLHQAARRIQRGEDPWLVLHAQGWITQSEAELLRIAQDNRHLAWALTTLGDASQSAREFKATAFAEFAAPLMLLCIGAVVAVIVYCFFIPLVFLTINMA
jgi:type IV pilus assembly protein PilC